MYEYQFQIHNIVFEIRVQNINNEPTKQVSITLKFLWLTYFWVLKYNLENVCFRLPKFSKDLKKILSRKAHSLLHTEKLDAFSTVWVRFSSACLDFLCVIYKLLTHVYLMTENFTYKEFAVVQVDDQGVLWKSWNKCGLLIDF